MPRLPDETQEAYLERLLALNADAVADLSDDDFKAHEDEVKQRAAALAERRKERAERKAEAERKAAAERKAEEERKAKKAEKARRKEEAEKAAKGKEKAASGSGKDKGKERKRERPDSDDEDGEEGPSKKQKREPCDRCSKSGFECEQVGSARNKACAACKRSKTKCSWADPMAALAAGSDGTDGANLLAAVEELTEAVQENTAVAEGGLEDAYVFQREIRGTLNDLVSFEAARLRLQFGDEGTAEADRILAARKEKRAKWALNDKKREDKKKKNAEPSEAQEEEVEGEKAD